MVDSPAVPPTGAKPAAPAPAPGDQSARIIALPDKLASTPRGLRIEGEVVRQNSDGSTRIRTSEGTLDIQLRGKPLEVGTKVQIDIPAGNPARQVTVRPAPEQAQPAQPPAAPPPVQTAPPPARPIPAPNVPLPPSTQAPVPLPGTPLPEQIVVRLTPAPPAQVQAVIQQTLNTVTTLPASVTTAALTATLIAQAVPDNLTQQLMNTVRPVAPLITAPPTPALATLPPMASTPPGATFLSQPMPLAGQSATQPTLTLIPTPSTTPGLVMAAPANTGGALPFQPLSAFYAPAVTTGIALSPKAMTTLDAVIARITPPTVQLVSAASTPSPLLSGTSATPIIGQAIQMPQATPATITATVIGTTPQGQPLVSVPLAGGLPQLFVVQFPASNLPIGAQIQIVPQPGQSLGTAATTAPVPLTQPLPLLQGSRWPVLTELLQTLQQTEPELAQAFARSLPSPANPRSLPAAALLFLAAAKGGDLTAWLGDKKLEAIQKLGKSGLLSRLSGDGQQMTRLSTEPVSNTDWRAVPMPMFWDSEIQKITLYFKRDGDASGQENKDGEQTRFIFDLSLTRMGDMQIDGLMRGLRLDLIVRSQSPFSQPMMAHMKHLYAGAIEDVNLSGDLSFQGDPRQWVQILQKEEQYKANA